MIRKKIGNKFIVISNPYTVWTKHLCISVHCFKHMWMITYANSKWEVIFKGRVLFVRTDEKDSFYRATIANANTESLTSLCILFDTYLDHILAKFELLDKKSSSFKDDRGVNFGQQMAV